MIKKRKAENFSMDETNINIKFSIIIPAFNAEKYLGKCIESALHQDISPYEIIIINDGSSDETLNIAEKYARIHTQIKLLTQVNSGLSIARNNGLDLAKGEYIVFLDADDYIIENSLQYLYNILKKNNLEVLAVKQNRYFSDYSFYESRMPINLNDREIISGRDCLQRFGMQIGVTAWSYLFKRLFLKENNIRFPAGLYHEDCFFTVQWLCAVNRLQVTKFAFYNQVLSDESIIRKRNIKKCYDLIEISSLIHSYVDNIRDEKTKGIIHEYGAYIAFAAIHSCINQKYSLCRFMKSEEQRMKIANYLTFNKRYKIIKFLLNIKAYMMIEIIVKLVDRMRKMINKNDKGEYNG